MKFKRDTVSDEIPTASMADIAFLLIIYFMVTTTFAATRGLDFSLPQEEEDTPLVDKEESVLIEIQPGGALLVDGKAMELDMVLDYLKPKLERNPKKPVIIKPDPEAPYGAMVGVFDVLRQIKIKTEGTAVAVYTVDQKRIQEAKEAEEDLGKDVNISIPTQREIESFWF